MTDWIKHDGYSRPVPPLTEVFVKFRNGDCEGEGDFPSTADFWCWGWGEVEHSHDIIAYRVHTPASEVAS